jgi:hypothetical protein
MDGMRWQYLKSVRQLLVGNEDLAFRDAFEKCARPCMNRHPIFLSESSASSSVSKSDFAFPVTSGIALAASGVPLPNRRKATS